jgi:hypothetical protein
VLIGENDLYSKEVIGLAARHFILEPRQWVAGRELCFPPEIDQTAGALGHRYISRQKSRQDDIASSNFKGSALFPQSTQTRMPLAESCG